MNNLPRSRSISPDRESCLKERYRSYSRVEGYVKHMNNIFNSQILNYGEYDEAHDKISKFRTQTPLNDSKFKVSHYPNKGNEVGKVLDAKKDISFKSKEFRPKSILSKRNKKKTKVKRTETNKKSLRYNKEKIGFQERCFQCFKTQCSCIKAKKNSFLNNLLRKSQENKIKSFYPSPAQDSKPALPLFNRRSVSQSESLAAELIKPQSLIQNSKSHFENFLKISSIQSFRKVLK